MANKRVFVSFDYDNDLALKVLLTGQAKNDSTPFEFADWSMKEAAPERNWEQEAERRIKQCDLILVIVGERTCRAPGVLKEISIARRNNIPVVQMKGPSGGTRVEGAGSLYNWSWDNLKTLCS